MIWIGILACLVISFTFSGIEAGVLSVNRVRLRHYALRGEEAALQLDALLTQVERLMITVVIITNVANILAIALLYTELTILIGSKGAVVALLISLPVFIVFVDFLPKAIFRRFPYRTLVIFARILRVAQWALSPVVNVGTQLARPLFRATRERETGRIVSEEDLKRVIAGSTRRRQLAEETGHLIETIIDSRTVRVADVMEPLERAPSVLSGMPVSEILDLARNSDADRFPVFDEDGRVSGIIRAFELLLDGVQTGRAQSYVRRVITVPQDEKILKTLRTLRAARASLAIVQDPAGKPLGAVTSEILVRQLLTGSK